MSRKKVGTLYRIETSYHANADTAILIGKLRVLDGIINVEFVLGGINNSIVIMFTILDYNDDDLLWNKVEAILS